MDLTQAEDIKKRWQEYTEEWYKKDLHDPDDHDGGITHLEPDILDIFDIPSLLSLFLAFHLSHPEDTEVSEECFKKASAKTQVLVKTLLTSCSLMFHRPKQVTWSRIQHQASPEWGVIHWEHYLST